jgi:hypothetical protein
VTEAMPFAVEETAAGPQALMPGLSPITGTDRLRWRADAPLAARVAQRACDLGLFDLAARDQLDLFSKFPPGSLDG